LQGKAVGPGGASQIDHLPLLILLLDSSVQALAWFLKIVSPYPVKPGRAQYYMVFRYFSHNIFSRQFCFAVI